MQSLGLNEVGGGYLFLATAVGIAIGARIAGRLSKDRVEIGLACLSGFFIVLIFFLLSIFSTSLFLVIIFLILLGIFGGMFLIPLESFIQVASPDKRRGQVIAASNFLSFTCVLLAALCLYLLNEKLGLSAAGSFAVIGLLTLIFNGTVSARMSSFFFPYFSEKVLTCFYDVEVETALPDQNSYIVMQKYSILDIFLLFYVCKSLKIIMLAKPFERFPWITGIVNSIFMMSPSTNFNTTLQRLFIKAKNLKSTDTYVIIFVKKEYENEMVSDAFKKVFGPSSNNLYFLSTKSFKMHDAIIKRKSIVYGFRK